MSSPFFSSPVPRFALVASGDKHPARPGASGTRAFHGRVPAETPVTDPLDRPRRRRACRPRARHDRLALQAARLHLPVVGDLRRHQRRVGLRPARRRAQEQRQARLVAGDGPGARRHRRARRRDPHAPAGLGHVRPRRLVQRPAGRVPDRPPPLPPRRAAGRRAPDRDRAARPGDRRAARPACPVDGGPLSRAAPVQPHVQDVHGPGRGGRVGHLPPPRDRPGLVRQLQERPAVVAQEAAVRDRPDRQVVPQRDQPGQLRLPDARVRADGDAVLRPTGGGGGGGVRRLAAAAAGLVRALRRDARRACASASTRPTSWPTTRRRRSTSSTASRSAGRSSRASTTAATSTCRATPRRPARASSTSTRRPTSTSSRGSSRRPPAPTGRRSRSSSTPTARRRSAARRGSRWRSIPISRRTRWRSCRCSRSGPRSSSCATGSRPTSSAT